MNAATASPRPGSGASVERGILLVASATVFFSTGGLFFRTLDSSDPWVAIFWRCLTAALFLLGFMLARNGRATPSLFRAMGLPGLAVAGCITCATTAFIVALSLTSVAQTLVINSSVPLIAAVLGRVFLGERIGQETLATIVVVMVGMAVMVSSDLSAAGSLLGDLFAGLVAVSYACAIVLMRRFPKTEMMPAACTGSAMAALLSVAVASPLAVSGHDLPILVAFGIIQSGLALALLVTGARLLPAAHTALLSLIEPILGPVWVWLFVGETPPATTLIGGAIVLAAVTVNTLSEVRAAVRGLPAT